MSMIQCRACELIQPLALKCKRCGKVFTVDKPRGRAANSTPMPVEVVPPKEALQTLAKTEKDLISIALKYYSPRQAAKALGIGSTTIYRKIRRYGLVTPWEATHRDS
jgi:transcriptional regulator of acetoin/glycerol metabolism